MVKFEGTKITHYAIQYLIMHMMFIVIIANIGHTISAVRKECVNGTFGILKMFIVRLSTTYRNDREE